MLSCSNILFGFPAPIILALLINELHNHIFKRMVQSITYLPHFISMVVVCSFILDFTARDGVINNILSVFGFEVIPFMSRPEWFRPIYVISEIWQTVGWGSIIYLAALSGIDVELYEACKADGGGRFRQMFTVTLPGITPTIIVMLILRMGRIMNVGLEKVLLLYNPGVYETADIISTFVYRKGLIELDYSYSAAVGLFNSLVNFVLLLTVNKISKKVSETSLF
jgi:putative aldouronate transport system permease protein